MSRKARKNPRSGSEASTEDRVQGAAAPRPRNPRARWIVLGVFVLVAGSSTAATWWHFRSRRAVVVDDVVDHVVTERLGDLQQDTASLIRRHLEEIRSDPNSATAHARLGRVFEANNLWPEARNCYETAYRLQPEEPMWVHHAAAAAHRMGDFDDALALLRESAERFPDFAPLQYRYGDLLLEKDALVEAQAAFRRVLDVMPDSGFGYAGLGDIALRRGDYSGAVELLKRAVGLAPGYRRAHFLLGSAFKSLGRREQAKRHLKLGIGGAREYLTDSWSDETSEYETNVRMRIRRASQLRKSGEPLEAIRILEELKTAHSNNALVWEKLGISYLTAGRLREARDALLQSKRLDDSSVGVHINLTVCYFRMRRLEDALEEAEHAARIAPRTWDAHYYHALALTKLKRWEEAYAPMHKAMLLAPNAPRAYRVYGDICMRMGRFSEAKAQYLASTKRWPSHAPSHFGLAQACIALEEWDEASAALAVAQRLAPNDPGVRVLRDRLAKLRRE